MGCRDASIALDTDMVAQDGPPNQVSDRRLLLERKRVGRRWKQLAGPSPFFLLIYSDAAGANCVNDSTQWSQHVLTGFSKKFARFSDELLQRVAAYIVQNAPAPLVNHYINMEVKADSAVNKDETEKCLTRRFEVRIRRTISM